MVGALRLEPVFVVLDQADGLVTFGDDSVKFVLRQEAGNLVDVDANVIQGGCLTSHFKSFLVEVEGGGELTLLQQLVRLILVLAEGDHIELLLDDLEGLGRL